MNCLEPLLDCWNLLAAAGRLPFGHQCSELCPHGHQPERGLRAVQIVPNLVMHGVLDAHHLGPQKADFATDFINSVVHGLLEQKENTESRINKRHTENERQIVRRILEIILAQNNANEADLETLTIVAEAVGRSAVLQQEITRMPVIVDETKIPMVKNAIDATTKRMVAEVAAKQFPDFDATALLSAVTTENATDLIFRIVNAKNAGRYLGWAIGPENPTLAADR